MRSATVTCDGGLVATLEDEGGHFRLQVEWPVAGFPNTSHSLELQLPKEQVRNFLDVLLEEGDEETNGGP